MAPAKVYDISPNQARAYEPVDHRRKLTKEQVSSAVSLRVAGHTYKDIGAKLGVTAQAIFYATRAVLDPEKHEAVAVIRRRTQIAKSSTGKKIAEVLTGKAEPNPAAKARANREYMKRRRIARRALVDAIKSAPCHDCRSLFPPHVMQFDHRPGTDKRFNIGERLVAVPEDALIEEIAKCDIVCANCHCERTHARRTDGIL